MPSPFYGEEPTKQYLIMSRLARAINTLFGDNKVAEDSTDDEMAEALEQEAGADEGTDDSGHEETEVDEPETDETDEESGEDEPRSIEEQTAMVATLNDRLDKLAKDLATVKTSNEALKQTIAGMKVGKVEPKATGKAPDRKQFNTAKVVGDGKPQNEAKYK